MPAETILLLSGVVLAALGFMAGVLFERHRWNALIWWEKKRVGESKAVDKSTKLQGQPVDKSVDLQGCAASLQVAKKTTWHDRVSGSCYPHHDIDKRPWIDGNGVARPGVLADGGNSNDGGRDA